MNLLRRLQDLPRRRRSPLFSTQSNVPSAVENLEPKTLLSAVDCSVTIPANQTTITFVPPVDTTHTIDWEVATQPAHGTASWVNNPSTGYDQLTYSLAVAPQSLAGYVAANNSVQSAISLWATTEIGQISAYYGAVNTAIGQFGFFLNNWSNGVSLLGNIASGAGGATGNPGLAAGGFALSLLTTAYSANTSGGIADIVSAAQQACADQQAVAIANVATKVGAFNTSYAAQLALVPNPTVYTSDSFKYSVEDMFMTMPPGSMMPTYTYQWSTATVSVSMNVSDYSAMIRNVNAWLDANSGALNMHMMPKLTISDIYAGILLDYASDRGWTETYHPSTNSWGGDATDWPFMFDSEDIAQELNRIQYHP